MVDFTAVPDYTLDEEIKRNTLLAEGENGAEATRSKWSSSKSSWTLVFKNRTSAEMEVVRDFHALKKGMLTAFTWNRPATASEAAIEKTVRFGQDTFKFQQNRYNNFDFDIKLVEVL
jgi:hypothetical protein